MADTNTPLQWLAEVEAECRRERDELRAGFDNERSTLLARIRELRAEVERLTLCDAEHLERAEQWRAEVERLRAAVLAYDDELTQFSNQMYTFMFSRLRRLGTQRVDDDVLDELYAAMIVAAGRDPEL